MPVFLHVRARKFFYHQPDCPQRIFTERHPDWWNADDRKTLRLAVFFRHLAFALSAEAASNISSQYGATLSGDAFLYLIRKEQLPTIEEPRVIGLDEWALKKVSATERASATSNKNGRLSFWKAGKKKSLVPG